MSHQETAEFREAYDTLVTHKKAVQEYGLAEVEIPPVFFCNWLPEATQSQKLLKEKIQSRRPKCCFNHMVGLPTLKFSEDAAENEETELYGYEKRIIQKYKQSLYYAQNKTRGAGATEIKTIRHNAHKYLRTNVSGRFCLIAAGIRQELSNIMLGRMKELLDTIEGAYLIEPTSEQPSTIFLKSGAILKSIPASPDAMRSYQNVGDVDLEEAAFWKLNDDEPVLKAALPLALKSHAHINSLTTPNGQRGFNWDKIWNPSVRTQFLKHTINWREVVGIPVQNVEELEGLDFDNHDFITQFFKKKYENDLIYRAWHEDFFDGLTIDETLEVENPIIDPQEIVRLYYDDRPTYDQELDNQFVLSENRAFGDFSMGDFEPVVFEDEVSNPNIKFDV